MADDASPTTETTALLHHVAIGDKGAADRLMERLHASLLELAQARLRGDPKRRVVEPASLVTEVYLRLIGGSPIPWNDRVHFLAVASKMMRQVLIDLAREERAEKRGGGWQRVTLSGVAAVGDASGEVDMEILEKALLRLAEIDPRQARVVELRFFAGMTEEEVAKALEMSRRSVQVDWSHAKAWLKRELERRSQPPLQGRGTGPASS